ncbi:TetR family transcriptional regulator [Gordonia sp. NPDC003950]
MGTVPTLREQRQQQTSVDISDAALDLFARRGYTATTIPDIAAAAHVSVRTFHRYFPTKEDVIAPALDAGWRSYVDAFAARPDEENLIDGLVGALQTALDEPSGRRHRTFLRTLPTSPALASAWLSVHDRCCDALRPVLAGRIDLDPADLRAQFAAACVVTANRLAVENWARDPQVAIDDTVRNLLSAAGPIINPATGSRRSARRKV